MSEGPDDLYLLHLREIREEVARLRTEVVSTAKQVQLMRDHISLGERRHALSEESLAEIQVRLDRAERRLRLIGEP